MFCHFIRRKISDANRLNRLYHSRSENGVFGYRPKPKINYEGIKYKLK